MISPSEYHDYDECRRRFWLNKNPPENFIPSSLSAFDQLKMKAGQEFEKQIISTLLDGQDIVRSKGIEHTKQLIDEQQSIIYQAHLENKELGIGGNPDLLIRDDQIDGYTIVEIKHASNMKDKYGVQVTMYHLMMDGIATAGEVWLKDGQREGVNFDEFLPTTMDFINDGQKLLDRDRLPPAKYAHTKCSQCKFFDYCLPKFEGARDTSLIYGVCSRISESLAGIDIHDYPTLAAQDESGFPDIPYLKNDKTKESIVLQSRSILDGRTIQKAPIDLPDGTWVHFDIENNPLDAGEPVYLWGLLPPPYDEESFEYAWADSREGDKKAWIDFLNFVQGYLNRWPDLRLIHYGHHEMTFIKSYVERYPEVNHKVTERLIGDDSILYDISKPVKNSFVLPLKGYGLKDICRGVVGFNWRNEEAVSQWSVVQYGNYLDTKDPSIKKEILGYNCDDVLATRALEEWMREMQNE